MPEESENGSGVTPEEAREWFEGLNREDQLAILSGAEEPPERIQSAGLELETELQIEKVHEDGVRETVVDTRDGDDGTVEVIE